MRQSPIMSEPGQGCYWNIFKVWHAIVGIQNPLKNNKLQAGEFVIQVWENDAPNQKENSWNLNYDLTLAPEMPQIDFKWFIHPDLK